MKDGDAPHPGSLARPDREPLARLRAGDLMPIPAPLDDPARERPFKALSDQATSRYECILDDTCAVSVPRPATKADEDALVRAFLSGLDKLFTRENNWTFLQPLLLSMEHCARCQTCASSCHIFEASGRNELYRPTFRSDVMRRLYFKSVRRGGMLSAWRHGDIEVNWPLVARLIELAYRCNLCRRCAQTCPIGVDNGLIAHELRKVFSQEMGIAPREIHDAGSMLQLKVGSTTGMTAAVARDNIQFVDDDTSERTGVPVETPWDVEGADVLLVHNAGEILAWPESVGAFALILNAAGISWTMSSELAGYDSVNYGLWYDDAQFARVAVMHAEAARRLKVGRIVLGECGHAHKALSVVADRLLAGEHSIPRESAMTLLRDIVMSGRLTLDPARNDFPVTLHDPLQHGTPDGRGRAPARGRARPVPEVPRDDPARRRQLLLRRRQRVRDHERPQLHRLAVPGGWPKEARPGAGRVRRLPRAHHAQVSVRAVQQLQRPVPRHAGLLRALGAERS